MRCQIENGPSAGDDCPAMTLFTLDKEEVPTAFEEADETVYLLDFWATWCGPCQGPMEHNEKMLNENPQWEGKAKILAISLDDDVEAPRKRIEEKGWNKVGSLWGGAGGFGSKASQDFVVQGIPTCLLVHKGKILWRGHPSERNLAEDITALSEGQEVSFGGAASADAEEEAAMAPDEFQSKMTECQSVL